MCIVQNAFMNSTTKYEAYLTDMETTDLCQEYCSAKQKNKNHPRLCLLSYLQHVAKNPIEQEVMKSLTD